MAGVETNEIQNLESRIDQLVEFCQRLKVENHSLKAQNDDLAAEHARLIEKTRLARARIESMIGRLKALERG
ncbi:MAG: TIGR02449 family protein [Acidiferrobacterales bacterium]